MKWKNKKTKKFSFSLIFNWILSCAFLISSYKKGHRSQLVLDFVRVSLVGLNTTCDILRNVCVTIKGYILITNYETNSEKSKSNKNCRKCWIYHFTLRTNQIVLCIMLWRHYICYIHWIFNKTSGYQYCWHDFTNSILVHWLT